MGHGIQCVLTGGTYDDLLIYFFQDMIKRSWIIFDPLSSLANDLAKKKEKKWPSQKRAKVSSDSSRDSSLFSNKTSKGNFNVSHHYQKSTMYYIIELSSLASN